jgi:hypothetical protein
MGLMARILGLMEFTGHSQPGKYINLFSDFHWSIQNESACIPQVSKAASQRLPDRSPTWKDFCDLQEQPSLQSTPEVSPLSLG